MVTKIVTIPITATIHDAVKTLLFHNISGAPVVDSGGKLLGIMTEKGIFRKLYPSYNDFNEDDSFFWSFERIESRAKEVSHLKVSEVMTPKVVCVHPDFPLAKAGGLILAKSIHRLIVTDTGREDGKIIGVVTRGDIYRALFEKEFNQ